LFEPAKKPFVMDLAIQMWTKEEPGIYDHSQEKMIGKAGGMLGKGKGLWFSVAWWLHPRSTSLNYLTISLTNKLFDAKKDIILSLFQGLIKGLTPIYGYITIREAEERQHITGTLKERIPGIFWLNYFSPIFVDYLSKDHSIYDFPWNAITEVDPDGVITQLSETPFDKTMIEMENLAHELFGESKFNVTAEDFPNILA
jgi:hypothetical protein